MFSRCLVSQVKHNSYFLIGLLIGLWVSLAVIPLDEEPAPCVATVGSASPVQDEFVPQREEKPAGSGQTAGRSVQRPRYYSTELGMRGSLLTGILSSEEALKIQVPALNRTAARLQPALKFFITASAMSTVPGLANVVGFTDTREMLKPFHALKYLADNYLEEYDFFFIVSDTAFVNARRLTQLVSQLSVSQDVYMGRVADDESHYCSLDNGIILSNSVLRAIHSELDWCVRNSYSPHHYENIGRCVLHSAHLSCNPDVQGEHYSSVVIENDQLPLTESLADAVTVYPIMDTHRFYEIHAYISRVFLERDHEEVLKLRSYMWHNSARHPPGYRNSTWPAGLRDDPGLARPLPGNRFDHLRWTAINGTHAFFPDDHHNVLPITGAYREALDLVLTQVRAWSLHRWPEALDVQLVEGAWKWEPAVALRYRLLLRLTAKEDKDTHMSRLVEAVRPLGAARLVPVRYVTESARLSAVLGAPHTARHAADLAAFLQRYEAVCLNQDKNTALLLVIVKQPSVGNTTEVDLMKENKETVAALKSRHKDAQIEVVETSLESPSHEHASEVELLQEAQRAALALALQRVPRDSLVLLAVPHIDFNQDFLNRVRMNTISGEQWYLPSAFSRYAQYEHPAFVTPTGAKPQSNTGRFNVHLSLVSSFYRSDYDSAVAEWPGPPGADPAAVLVRSGLRCVRAPEPGLVYGSRGAPCGEAGGAACVSRLVTQLHTLDLGAKHSLAQLLLETQAELDQ
ncbi:chondroitin sulfate synthase 2 [Bombyx mandarina]|uniref:Hexosyltransferase n=1 Tax=Bombyx mandarina TaxID=7092 RepID=A0A6J2JMA8_BOMMA|nr:chondroitin sulfate synthase 2 [Bombyx mandarina]